jgi:predicted subunit of tRNA(5-methylaminomethyl-2-thiouridylate) methyltransferase
MGRSLFTFLMVMSIGLGACHVNNQEKFIEKEKIEIQEKIEDILTELGYNDFSIHINYHKNFNNREVSKSIYTKKIFGDEIPINAIGYLHYSNLELVENQEFINNGYIEDRTYTVNYDEVTSDKIFYEYISIALLVRNIEQREINQLLKLLNNYILNNNRGDTIYIMSK